jgi:adenylate cyclase
MAVVVCAVCGAESPVGKRFCADCGAALPRVCPSCGVPAIEGKRFCADCGAPLMQEAQPPVAAPIAPAPRFPESPVNPPPTRVEEERRLVTALFCDLVGFTPLAEHLDPEEVRDIQSAYFGEMRTHIEQYGGTIEKYAGDAVLALFGAPIAHEDDAERAVLCALQMQRAVAEAAPTVTEHGEVRPSIRIGVNTGDVVSGVWQTGGRQDVAVTGDAVNTAARLQSVADAGEVLVGLETMRLTRRRVLYGERREFELKGKGGTVSAYAALGIRERFGERWEEATHASPLVGRDREMVRLLELWMRVPGGEGQLITLIGDSGVGKSRLIAEFVERVAESGSVRVARGRCLSYGQEISLWLVADMLRSLHNIPEQADPEEVRALLTSGLTPLLQGLDADLIGDALDVMGEVLGLPPSASSVSTSSAQVRRQTLIRSLRLAVGRLSERAPTVLVLEDLHWVDAASQEVLVGVMSDVPGLRICVLVAQRPGWTAPWNQWGWTERTTLRPLREDDAIVLAEAVLGGVRLSSQLEQYVAERAGGNPFFVEEMLHALDESGGLTVRGNYAYLVPGATDRPPSTLTEVLLARLDRLPDRARSIAQVASVIGRSFSVRLLAAVLGENAADLEDALTVLQQSEIAFPRRAGDVEYVFKHVSMQEVAYNTLVQRRRAEFHLRTARGMASIYPSDEYAEIIAYHYARTEEHAESAIWLERAGDRAAASYALDAAFEHYRGARQRLERLSAPATDLARIDVKLAGVHAMAERYDEALEHLERAIEVFRLERDLEAAGLATAQVGMVMRVRGTPEGGIARVRSMIDLLSWSGPSHALGQLHLSLAHLYLLRGNWHEQHEAAERAAVIARSVGDDMLLAEAEERRGTAVIMLGRYDEGRQIITNALPLVERSGDPIVLWRTLNNLGEACKYAGELQDAIEYSMRSLQIAERLGGPDRRGFVLANLGNLYTNTGDWPKAQEYCEMAIVLGQESDGPVSMLNGMGYLGQLQCWQGELEDARRNLEESIRIGLEVGDRQTCEESAVSLAEVFLAQGDPEAAREQLAKVMAGADGIEAVVLAAMALVELQLDNVDEADRLSAAALEGSANVMRLSDPEAMRVRGLVLARLGRTTEAGEMLHAGLRLARKMPQPYIEARILRDLATLEGAGSRADSSTSRDHLTASLEIFTRIGAHRDAAQVRELLETADAVPSTRT